MRIHRREFLKISLAGTLPLFLGRTSDMLAYEAEVGAGAGADEVLVVLQLSGGNDGLSTLIPHGDDAYHKVRTTIRHQDVRKLDGYVGLHPNLDRVHAMYQEGQVAIVQGASYPNPNRSHFEAMDIWHTGDRAGRASETGWVGRTVDACCEGKTDPELMINIGNNVPYALRAERIKPVSLQNPQSYAWRGPQHERAKGAMKTANTGGDDMGASGGSNVDFLRRVGSDALASSAAIRMAAAHYEAKAQYPGGPLGRDLRTVAALVHARLGTRVFYASFGGFDTHVRQRGAHDNLMRQLGDAVAAFHADLAAHGHGGRVVTMAFSEFGRRVQENASAGTDHGVAGPMFVFGERVKGGLYSKYPSLTDLQNGDLKMTCDFRSVYADVIDGWLGASSVKILGERYPSLGIFDGAGAKGATRAGAGRRKKRGAWF